MTKDEALKLALEFLERPAWRHEYALANINQASTAIKEALANVATEDTSQERVDEMQKQRHEQKPYGYVRADGKGLFIYGDHQFTNNYNHDLVPVYTHPKEWVGLTDDEREELMDTYDVASTDYVHAIEAKLKEKNT